MADNNDDPNKSVFNAGVALVVRIAEIKTMINFLRLNPLGISPDGIYNYISTQRQLISLWMETRTKATPQEIERIEKIKNLVDGYIKNFPVVSTKGKIINKNLEAIITLLEKFETDINVILEVHDLNSPNKSNVSRSVAEMS